MNHNQHWGCDDRIPSAGEVETDDVPGTFAANRPFPCFEHLQHMPIADCCAFKGNVQLAKRAFETRYVEGLLRRCAGNISRAARLAKKDRKDFYDVIRRTGVDPTEFRS